MEWKLENVESLKDKLIVVTGGNSGLGLEAIKHFVSKEANIVMASRSEERALEAIKLIKSEYPNANVTYMKLDLSSKKQIKEFVNEFTNKYDKLDILLNNAGVMTTPFMHTEDGIELQQGINHFGHFYLNALLFKTIKNTPNSRIVVVSSIAHRYNKLNFDNLLYENGKYNKMYAYARSKLENLLYTYELDRRIKEKGLDVKVIASHPGVAKTNLGRHIKSNKGASRMISGFQKFFSHTASDGALSLVRACLDESLTGGEFIGPSKGMGTKGSPHIASSTRYSHNKSVQKQLWDYSEKLMNIDFVV